MNQIVFPEILSAVSHSESIKLAELATDKIVLELGSHFGYSTIVMAQTAKIVHAVDWHLGDCNIAPGDSLSSFFQNINRYEVRSKVFMHIGKFEDMDYILNNKMFELIFLDGCHIQEAVTQDICMIEHRLKDKGYWAFHDYNRPSLPGVKLAVDEFLLRNNLQIEVIDSLGVVKNG